MALRCLVCGYESDALVCPICNTMRPSEPETCARCGEALGPAALTCDACGAPTGRQVADLKDPDAIRSLTAVPGISEERAQRLVAQGFRDFSDIVRLALPENAIRLGLHHTIARRAMLSPLEAPPGRPLSGDRCPMCGAPWSAGATRCGACGSQANLEVDGMTMDGRLREITGEVVDLAADPDFQEMPENVRQEFLQAFGGVDERSLLREEYHHQVEAWRSKGFDVAGVERLLNEDFDHFREQSRRLIRVQVMKAADGARYRCPLCDLLLDRTAEECGNCGARFS